MSLFAAVSILTACKEKQRVEGLPDEFSGVGIEITQTDDKIHIVSIVPGSPAADVGLQPGDIILAVDAKPTSDMSLGEVVIRMRGATQSQVTLTIDRHGESQTVIVSRRRIRKTGGTYVPTD